MARKRLGDLLREEAHKPLDLEVESVQSEQESTHESSDLEVEAAQKTTPEELLEPDATISVVELPDEIPAEPSVDTSITRSRQRPNPTKAELEATVTDLREELQEVRQKEDSLQQQIAGLQLELQEQKTLVQKLQAERSQEKQIKAELEQAKKVILQLSEINTKQSEEVNTSKKETKAFSQRMGLNKIPYHSIQKDSPSTTITDKDIGWVD